MKVHSDWPGEGFIPNLEPVIIILIFQVYVQNQKVGSALDRAQATSEERTNPPGNLKSYEYKEALILKRQNKNYPRCRRYLKKGRKL